MRTGEGIGMREAVFLRCAYIDEQHLIRSEARDRAQYVRKLARTIFYRLCMEGGVATIRNIEEADIEGFHQALSGVVNEQKYLLTLSPPSLENVSCFIRKNIENNTAQYVADENGEIIGWADIVPKEVEAMRHVGLLGMGIVTTHRGKGIGSELLNIVISHAFDNGLKRIELEVFSTNTVATKLYEKNGFEHEGTKRNARYLHEKYEDVHLMAQCRI